MPTFLGLKVNNDRRSIAERAAIPGNGYATSDILLLQNLGILKSVNGSLVPTADPAKIRQFFTWALSDKQYPLPSLIREILCTKRASLKDGVASTGTTPGLRNNEIRQIEQIDEILRKDGLGDPNKQCPLIVANMEVPGPGGGPVPSPGVPVPAPAPGVPGPAPPAPAPGVPGALVDSCCKDMKDILDEVNATVSDISEKLDLCCPGNSAEQIAHLVVQQLQGGQDPIVPVGSTAGNDEVGKLKQELQAALAAQEEAEENAKRIMNDIQNCVTETADLQDKLAAAEAAKAELQTQLAAAQTATAETAEIADLQNQLAAAKAEVEGLKAGLAAAQAAKNTTEADKATLQGKLAAAEAAVEAAKAELQTQLNAANAATSSALAAQEEAIKAAETANNIIKEMEATKAEVQAQVAAAVQASVAEVKRLEAELAAARAATEELRGQLDAAIEAKKTCMTEVEGLRTDLATAQAAKHTAEAVTAGLQGELVQARADLAAAEAARAAVEAASQASAAEIATLQGQLGTAEAARREAVAQLAEKDAARAAVEAAEASQTAAIVDLQKRLDEVNAAKNAAEAATRAAEAATRAAEAATRAAEAEITAKAQEATALQEQLAAAQAVATAATAAAAEAERLKADLAAAEAARAGLQQQVTAARTENSALQKANQELQTRLRTQQESFGKSTKDQKEIAKRILSGVYNEAQNRSRTEGTIAELERQIPDRRDRIRRVKSLTALKQRNAEIGRIKREKFPDMFEDIVSHAQMEAARKEDMEQQLSVRSGNAGKALGLVDKMKSERNAAAARASDAERNRSAAREEARAAQAAQAQRIAQAEQELQRIQAAQQSVAERAAKAEQQLKERNATIAAQSEQARKAQEEREAIERNRVAAKTELEGLKSSQQQFQQRLNAETARADNALTQIETVRAAQEAQAQQIARVEQERNAAIKAQEAQRQTVEQLQTQLAAAVADTNAKITARREAEERMQKELRGLQTNKNAALQSRNAALQQVEEARVAEIGQRAAVEQLQAQLDKALQNLRTLQQEKEKAEALRSLDALRKTAVSAPVTAQGLTGIPKVGGTCASLTKLNDRLTRDCLVRKFNIPVSGDTKKFNALTSLLENEKLTYKDAQPLIENAGLSLQFTEIKTIEGVRAKLLELAKTSKYQGFSRGGKRQTYKKRKSQRSRTRKQ